MTNEVLTTRQWQERVSETRQRLMEGRRRAWPEGHVRRCPSCSETALAGRSDLVREVDADGAVLVFANLHGARCEACGNEFLEGYEQVAIEERAGTAFRRSIEGSVTTLGGRPHRRTAYIPATVGGPVPMEPSTDAPEGPKDPSDPLDPGWRDALVDVAHRAGQAILEIYNDPDADFELDRKADDSPLTKADLAANAVIIERLQVLAPEVPIISEESRQTPAAERRAWIDCWLVDPLDGTKEFLKRNGEFTVNIAWVRDGRPVMGVVHAPDLGTTYFAQTGAGAVRIDADGTETRLRTRPIPQGEGGGGEARDDARPLRVVASRSHRNPDTEAFLAALPEHELVPSGSSLKFCRIADGDADVYPRLAPTMEWDTGAAQAVLEAAGGAVVTMEGDRLRYNKDDLLNPYFIAVADPDWERPAVQLPSENEGGTA